MNLVISGVRPATSEEWDEIWNGCEYATYFHSRQWAETWTSYTGGKISPTPWLVLFSDGNRALLPLSINRRYKGLVRECQSSPGGTFGGWIAIGELRKEHGALLVDFMMRQFRNLVWRRNPFDYLTAVFEIEGQREDETHVLDLSSGFESVFKGWSKGHASAAKKARREGVDVRMACSPQDWREYFAVYQDSQRRWGDRATSSYSLEFFEALRDHGAGNVRLWLGVYSGRVVAGALCLYARQHVVYWHGAALEEFFFQRPVHYVLYEAIRHACESGYRWFDYNPSGGHEGVRSFKRNFGTAAMPCPVVSHESGLIRMINAIRGKS